MIIAGTIIVSFVLGCLAGYYCLNHVVQRELTKYRKLVRDYRQETSNMQDRAMAAQKSAYEVLSRDRMENSDRSVAN